MLNTRKLFYGNLAINKTAYLQFFIVYAQPLTAAFRQTIAK
jgi:hypothetical protein